MMMRASQGIERSVPQPSLPESAAARRSRYFAKNLSDLLDLLPTNMRKASEGTLLVPYKWLRRVVSTGISRVDERSSEHLQKIANHFELPAIEDLWRRDLLCWLLETRQNEGSSFFQKFRSEIIRLQEDESKRLIKIRSDLENFDYKRSNMMQNASGSIAIFPQQPPMADSDVVRFLNEKGYPGLIEDFREWRRGGVPQEAPAPEQRNMRTGTEN